MTTITGLLITADGEPIRTTLTSDPGEGDATYLHSMYDAIGCKYVDVVRLSERIDAWIDDDSMFTDEPENILGSLIASVLSGRQVWPPLRGKVLLLGTDGKGECVSLTDEQEHRVADIATRAMLAMLELALVGTLGGKSPDHYSTAE